MMNDIDREIAKTVLNKLFAKKWFDITTLDNLLKVLKVHPSSDVYDRLHALHCVHWGDMTVDLQLGVRDLIMRACNGLSYEGVVYEDEDALKISFDKGPTMLVADPEDRPRKLQ